MKIFKNLFIEFALWFDGLEPSVKAGIFIALNATFSMLASDLADISVNKYIDTWIGAGVNILAFIALHFGAKVTKVKKIK